MRKLACSAFIAAGLMAGGAAFAQGETSGPTYGPLPGTPEYYNNSGAPPENLYGARRAPYYGAAPAYPYVLPERQFRRDRDDDRVRNRRDRDRDDDGVRNSRDRDRDGDGVRNNRDRYPDNARRQ